MSIDIVTLRKAVKDWVVHGSGLDDSAVIFAGQGGPPPRVGHPGELHPTWIIIAFPSVRRHGMDWSSIVTNPITFAPIDFASDGTLTTTAPHGLATGTGPVRIVGAPVPVPLVADTDYWVIVDDETHMQLASSFVNAMSDASIIVTVGAGSIVPVDGETVAQGAEILHRARGPRSVLVQLTCFSDDVVGDDMAPLVLDRVLGSLNLPAVRELLEDANVGEGPIGDITSLGLGVGTGSSNIEPRAFVEVWLHASGEHVEAGTFIERATGDGTIVDETGGEVAIPFTVPDEPGAGSSMVLFWGQSNSMGATAGANALDSIAHPSTWPYQYRIGGVANPPNWVNRGWLTLGRALGPDGATYYAGPEIGVGQRLDELGLIDSGEWVGVYKCALASSGMEHWSVDGTFPTLDPDGKTAHDRYREEASAAATFLDAVPRMMIVNNGEADASSGPQANLYQSRMLAWQAFMLEAFPQLVIVICRLNDTFAAPFAATVRAAQDALGALPGFITIDIDDIAMSGDSIHYPIASHVEVGRRAVDAYLASQ